MDNKTLQGLGHENGETPHTEGESTQPMQTATAAFSPLNTKPMTLEVEVTMDGQPLGSHVPPTPTIPIETAPVQRSPDVRVQYRAASEPGRDLSGIRFATSLAAAAIAALSIYAGADTIIEWHSDKTFKEGATFLADKVGKYSTQIESPDNQVINEAHIQLSDASNNQYPNASAVLSGRFYKVQGLDDAYFSENGDAIIFRQPGTGLHSTEYYLFTVSDSGKIFGELYSLQNLGNVFTLQQDAQIDPKDTLKSDFLRSALNSFKQLRERQTSFLSKDHNTDHFLEQGFLVPRLSITFNDGSGEEVPVQCDGIMLGKQSIVTLENCFEQGKNKGTVREVDLYAKVPGSKGLTLGKQVKIPSARDYKYILKDGFAIFTFNGQAFGSPFDSVSFAGGPYKSTAYYGLDKGGRFQQFQPPHQDQDPSKAAFYKTPTLTQTNLSSPLFDGNGTAVGFRESVEIDEVTYRLLPGYGVLLNQ